MIPTTKKKTTMIAALVSTCAAALLAAPSLRAFGDGAEVGKAAPAFELVDQNGKSHKLSDFAGKTVVLEWFNPDCPFIVGTYEKGLASSTIEALKKDGAVFIAINSTGNAPLEEVRKKSVDFLAKNKIDHPVLFDHDGAVGRAYGAKTTPHVYVIDGKGTLRYHGAFSNDPKFAGNGAKNYVLEACKAVKAGGEVKPDYEKPWGCSVKYKTSN